MSDQVIGDLPVKWEWRLWKDPTIRWGVRVFLFGTHLDGRFSYFELRQLAETSRHAPAPQLMRPLDEHELRAFLQPLIDEAAKFGVLPGNMEHVVAAQARHLEDMRSLVFERAKPGAGGAR